MPVAPISFTTRQEALDALRARALAGRAWLFDDALPLWWAKGYDARARCFHEVLELSAAPAVRPRRVRVQARQTAVYAYAGQLGWDGPWRDATSAGADVLLGVAANPDGGVRHLLDQDGEPLDSRRDLYDLAFVIFGLAHAGHALARADLIAAAETHVDWLEENWRHDEGGFFEGEVDAVPPRRQNPHMHLFEALMALYETTREPAHLKRALHLFELFTTRLYDIERGMLPEFFDHTWRPTPGEQGRIGEPGHHFEWCWLLLRYAALTGGRPHLAAASLHAYAEAHGMDSVRGVAQDVFPTEGAPQPSSTRLWPQTERLKANAALFELTGALAYAARAAQAFDTLQAYFDTPTPGLWRDRMTLDGAFIQEPAPASSFYHIIVALDDLVRRFAD